MVSFMRFHTQKSCCRPYLAGVSGARLCAGHRDGRGAGTSLPAAPGLAAVARGRYFFGRSAGNNWPASNGAILSLLPSAAVHQRVGWAKE